MVKSKSTLLLERLYHQLQRTKHPWLQQLIKMKMNEVYNKGVQK